MSTLLLAASAAAPAAGQTAAATAGSAPGTVGAIGGTLLALVVVVGLILALAWVLRRLPGAGPRSQGALRVVASLPVGMKERVVVVQAGEQQWLLGVTAERITRLDRLESPLPEAPQGDTFAAQLARRMQRGGSRT